MNLSESWSYFNMFFSSQKTQDYLAKQYERLEWKDYNGKSFENCYGFIYYIEHGKKYYQLAETASDELKPVLLFYGMIQLLKACILTEDPDYPDSSSVLAHGLTTRKRKKRSYDFLLDEVKVQKTGLFNHFCEKLFHMKHIEGEKLMMGNLLKLLPELNPLHQQMEDSVYQMKMEKINKNTFSLDKQAADFLYLSDQRLEQYLNTTFSTSIKVENKKDSNHFLVHLLSTSEPYDCFPLTYHIFEKQYYFLINRDLFLLPNLNEIMVHYVLLYNLSMISRYDTEWWSDLFHTYSSKELPFIKEFLNVTSRKIPYLLGLYLHKKNIT